MVKSGLASPLFLCKYPQENITIQRVVAKQADTLQQTARIRLAAGKGRSMRRKEEIEAYAENLFCRSHRSMDLSWLMWSMLKRQEAGICVSTLTKRAVSQ